MGEAKWDVEHLVYNADWNTPNKKENVPEVDEVPKHIDALIENKNYFSDWICSKVINRNTYQIS